MEMPRTGSIYQHKKTKTRWVVVISGTAYVNLREDGSGHGKMTISLSELRKQFKLLAETETAR